jgi:hypothetical protein
MGGFFECCHHCPSTKRHPGCHDVCPEYKEAKKSFEAAKEAEKRDRMVSSAKTDYLNNAVWRKKKYHGR